MPQGARVVVAVEGIDAERASAPGAQSASLRVWTPAPGSPATPTQVPVPRRLALPEWPTGPVALGHWLLALIGGTLQQRMCQHRSRSAGDDRSMDLRDAEASPRIVARKRVTRIIEKKDPSRTP